MCSCQKRWTNERKFGTIELYIRISLKGCVPMTIKMMQNGEKLTLQPDGRIDTNTSADLASALETLDGISELELDFAKVSYISSAGLRVLLKTHKQMLSAGGMKLINVNDSVMDVFTVTGLSDVFTIK